MTPSDTWRSSIPRLPMVETLAGQHLRRVGDHDLITVVATPNGVASYLAGQEDARVAEIRHEHHAVVVRARHEDYGTVITVLGGPSVVEIALHDTDTQRDTFRAVTAEVDAENRTQMLASVQAAAVGMLRELGVTVDQDDDLPGAGT